MAKITATIQIPSSSTGKSEAVVIIKAAPQVGQKHGETVCCAVIDLYGNWLRLYPVAFRSLEVAQKFKRWDRIKFSWRMPRDDSRIESRRVNHQSLQIVGQIRKSERQKFLAPLIKTSLQKERDAGRSLALLKAEILEFIWEKKTASELSLERKKFREAISQADMFHTKPLLQYKPAPYRFKYRYETEDGFREGTCQDWEIEATFFNWRKQMSETDALQRMTDMFGTDYPAKGMLLAMGTHSLHPETWLINGIIRLDHIEQPSLF